MISISEALDLCIADKEATASTQIDEAMRLYKEATPFVKRIFFHATGFTGAPTDEAVRDHLDTLELLDGLDDVIENFNDNADHEV